MGNIPLEKDIFIKYDNSSIKLLTHCFDIAIDVGMSFHQGLEFFNHCIICLTSLGDSSEYNYYYECTTPQFDTYDHTSLHSYSQPGATDCQIVQADNRSRGSYQPVTSINPANLYNNAFQPIRQSVNQHLPYPVPVNTYSAADAYQRSY